MKKFFFYLLNFTWGLLQNIIGFGLFIKYIKSKKEFFHSSLITYHDHEWGGISLGMFIFINGKRDSNWIETTKVHEYGHCIQSLILGPFYFLFIAIPSFIWCNTKKCKTHRKNKNISYFDFYPEKWANYLGEKITDQISPRRYFPPDNRAY